MSSLTLMVTTLEDAMRIIRTVLPSLLLVLLFFGGCTQDPPTVPDPAQQSIGATDGLVDIVASEALALAEWECEEMITIDPAFLAKTGCSSRIVDFERVPLGGGIVHYRFRVRVGAGAHDLIGLHRVVKESGHCRPVKVKDAIFLLHGDAKDFEGMFLPYTRSTNLPDRFGLAVYLAERDVDVWGIDQAWTLVPSGTSNFTFMKDWGLQRNIDDLRTGIAIARSLRFATGFGADKMILLGYSSGGATGYATLNHETQVPMNARQVRGFVSADLLFKSDDPAIHRAFTNDLALYEPNYNNGIYQAEIPFQPMGMLARTNPGGDSPIIPGLTNLQTALYFGCGPIFALDVSIHYLSGYMDATGFPAALRLVTLPQWYDFLEAGVPYESNKFIMDYDKVLGNVFDSPFDDHLAEIRVPILNLGAKGGLGPYTVYGTTLLGSTDITHKIVEVGTGNVLTEFGHIDLFLAPQAPALAWQPMVNWLKAHRN
jgi:hypothetical protein